MWYNSAKRSSMKNKKNIVLLIIFAIIIIFMIIGSRKSNGENVKPEVDRITVHYKDYINMKPTLSYSNVYDEPEFDNLKMIGSVGKYGVYGDLGKALRTWRFENITSAVEDRYNLPRHLILAMIMEETNGVDLLPNGSGDGGYGLCHMQPPVASQFGLSVYKDCKGMVCNGKDKRSCKSRDGQSLNHAAELKNILVQNNYDRKKVIKYDDRLHPILNIDAVGRMIASYMDGPRIEGCGPLRTAICRYAGRYNYASYWKDVRRNMKLLSDPVFMKKVEDAFNKANPNLIVNGEEGDFDMYIDISQNQAYNYGLEEYINLPKFLPKNSEIVLATIDDF